MNTYFIQIRGAVDLEELNMLSPHRMTLVDKSETKTLFTITTDQSGMIGTLGHLHSLGLTLLAIQSQEEKAEVRK